jgi:DNA-binding XRE family transcriptional regulator
MSLAKKFSDLRAKMSPEARTRSHELALRTLLEIPLRELREAREKTQQDLANAFGTSQASISQMEKRTDIYVSTLRRYIQALGGDLEITARFPSGEVRLLGFADLEVEDDPALV